MSQNICIEFISFQLANKELCKIFDLDFGESKFSSYLSIDGILLLASTIKHQYKEIHPKSDLADLGTEDFLNAVVGYLDNNDEVILITHDCYNLEMAFKGKWIDIYNFCNEVYSYLFKVGYDRKSFVQGHDYIFIIPAHKQIIAYHHNNIVFCWCMLP